LNAVVCAALFQYTTDVEMKPVPEIFNVKPGPPAVALDGKRLMIAGVSLKGWLLLPQPTSSTSITATDTSAAERKRINPNLP